MDGSTTPTSSVRGSPLQAMTPDRVNRRDSSLSNIRLDGYESPVLEKISQFNNLNPTPQSKQLERKTAEAAIKRAILGREEAEAEMRTLRDENQSMRKALDDAKVRERKVGERLETLMDNYGRSKETHAHTQALWEKEIRRGRKENFKAQSTIVKLQEELKTARTAAKINEECITREKERSHAREQEAFTARYQIVGVQEQLEKALERIKVVEQERDAFKTAAKNEEVARLAVEGRIPLPTGEDFDDELNSPNKKLKKRKRDSVKDGARVSLSTMEIMSSVASELEIEDLTMQVMRERQRADRAQEMIEFLEAECQMHVCPCSKSKSKSQSPKQQPESPQLAQSLTQSTPRVPTEVIVEETVEETIEETVEEAQIDLVEETKTMPVEMEIEEPTDTHHVAAEPNMEIVEAESELIQQPEEEMVEDLVEPIEPEEIVDAMDMPEEQHEAVHELIEEVEELAEADAIEPAKKSVRSKKERRSTIFCPKDGTFRTVSEQEAVELAAQQEIVIDEEPAEDEIDIVLPESVDVDRSTRMYARTPSVEPPSCAMMNRDRTSLQSLLSAPHEEDEDQAPTATFTIPTIPDSVGIEDLAEDAVIDDITEVPDLEPTQDLDAPEVLASPEQLPLNNSRYKVTTTTVPVRDEETLRSSSFNEKLRTPSNGSNASFDLNDPALTPTMTREQALAKIRERRGRAKSFEKTAAAPVKGKATPTSTSSSRTRRDLSATSKSSSRGRK